MNLSFSCNVIFYTTKYYFSTLLPVILQLFMGRMNEEQIVFEQLTLSDFKKLSSTALNTFNGSTIIMTNNNDKIVILYMRCFLSVPYFQVNSTGCSGEFRVVFKHFQNLENHILNILKEKLYFSYLVGPLFLKTV